MKNKLPRFKRIRLFLIVLFSLTLLLAISYLAFSNLRRIMARNQLENLPPTITVHKPKSGDTYLSGAQLTASATAAGSHPISRLELWLDGNLYDQQVPGPEDALNEMSFYARFEIDLSQGLHHLVFRSVDEEGLVGQSLAIPLRVTSGLEEKDTATVNTEGGQTLEDIAVSLGGEPEILQELNPDLGEGELPAGTEVNIPASAEITGESDPDQSPEDILPDSNPPDALPVTGIVMKLQSITMPALTFNDITSILLSSAVTAPSALQAGYKDCAIQLLWYDNTEQETHFNIWMQRVYGPPQHIATTPSRPGKGPTMYEFKSPGYGFYTFWVEAANGLGVQPSEVVEVSVSDQDCDAKLATYLEIVGEDMFLFGNYDRAYCYLSLENRPEKRIPENDGEFIKVNDHWGNISDFWGQRRILLPMPADEEMTIAVECLGWQGETLYNLGYVQDSIPKSQWDGSRLELQFPQSDVIGYHIQPLGSTQAEGAFQYVNYELPAPQIQQIERRKADPSADLAERNWLASQVTLSWLWDGDLNDINSFLILIDGQEFRYIDKQQHQASFFLGTSCGQAYSFQVVAVGSGGARSVPSTTRAYQQEDCAYFARVTFYTLTLTAHDDGEGFGNNCDQAEMYVYGDFRVEHWDHPSVLHTGTDVNCNQPIKFSALYGVKDSFQFSWGPGPAVLDIHLMFGDVDSFGVPWDHDTICSYSKQIRLDINEWPSGRRVYRDEICQPESSDDKGSVSFDYSVEIIISPQEP